MASNKINVPTLYAHDIRRIASEFCQKYNIDRTEIPVDVENIVEFDLKLELRPQKDVLKRTGVDALLLSNRKAIIVDHDRYMQDNLRNRLRFTIAHEIGHFILHEKVYEQVQFQSVEEWANFIQTISDEDYNFLEWHCHEFAGLLLVDGTLLKQKFEERVQQIRQKLKGTEFEKLTVLPEPVIETLAGEIGKDFGVSSQPIMKRLQREKLWTND
ncbi:MAG: ImmA/IrrE family metallo-endopeptidase [Candidatus Obscuribacterales bacterium]|nr:ImmA/IrrE family metallo-endopeptidase [Candidatus Obscuribacterales bacterium]